MRILVTGAGGFLGGHLAGHLAERGHEVVALRRRAQPEPAASGRSRVVVADLAEGAVALPAELDAVVHAAATVGISGVPTATYVRDNVLATHRLVAHAVASRVRRFVYISSTSVHGTIGGPVLDEHTPILDPGTYGLTKLLGERLVADAAPAMAGIALRLPAVVGPGAHSNFPARLLDQIEKGGTVTLFNPSAQYNNVAHVDDLGPFIADLLERGWSGFDAVPLGAEGTTTIREAAMVMMRAHGSALPIVAKPAERTPFVVSSRAARERYGYRPMTVEAMLERYVRASAATQPARLDSD